MNACKHGNLTVHGRNCHWCKTLHNLIMRNICETLPADPENERTVCINYENLDGIVKAALLEKADE